MRCSGTWAPISSRMLIQSPVATDIAPSDAPIEASAWLAVTLAGCIPESTPHPGFCLDDDVVPVTVFEQLMRFAGVTGQIDMHLAGFTVRPDLSQPDAQLGQRLRVGLQSVHDLRLPRRFWILWHVIHSAMARNIRRL